MKNLKPNMKQINLFSTLVLVGIWIALILGSGMVRVLSWTMLLIIIPLVGFFYFLISIFMIFRRLFKEGKIRKEALFSILLSIVMIIPFSITLGLTEIVYPSSHEASDDLVIVSPFKEDVIIGWGGNSAQDNKPHVIWASERYAYDLVKAPYNTGAINLKEYGIYGLECFSPVEGIVIAAYDNEPDIPPNTETFTSLAGNHVYIYVKSTETYLLLTHFQMGTIAVSVGDEVKAGDYLGRVGNSGTTSEPHLHIHHQRQDPTKTIHPILAEGLPLLFTVSYRANDGSPARILIKGDILPRNETLKP
ncbi:M23 family metallopeptidase [Alkaliphilus transvaalensis]|uniref:M23 family metallopeptidase n=1 Tax=Alkaliphilus transvaalensis TaxID=114628 RepID=UPI000A72B944|nr:M23 family metallopeptidase [Alkaliphilus transvaalensis]